MKNVLILIGTLSFSSLVFAKMNCEQNAIELAKINLKIKSIAYGNSAADALVYVRSLKLIESRDGSHLFTVPGTIVQSPYQMTMSLDEACSLQSLSIKGEPKSNSEQN